MGYLLRVWGMGSEFEWAGCVQAEQSPWAERMLGPLTVVSPELGTAGLRRGDLGVPRVPWGPGEVVGHIGCPMVSCCPMGQNRVG